MACESLDGDSWDRNTSVSLARFPLFDLDAFTREVPASFFFDVFFESFTESFDSLMDPFTESFDSLTESLDSLTKSFVDSLTESFVDPLMDPLIDSWNESLEDSRTESLEDSLTESRELSFELSSFALSLETLVTGSFSVSRVHARQITRQFITNTATNAAANLPLTPRPFSHSENPALSTRVIHASSSRSFSAGNETTASRRSIL